MKVYNAHLGSWAIQIMTKLQFKIFTYYHVLGK